MTILHLKLHKGKNIIRLLQTPIKTATSLKVLRCFIAWSLKNIRETNNTLTRKKDSTTSTITLPQGYYNFTQLKSLLEIHSITIEKLADNRVTLFSKDYEIDVKTFGPLLGFDENQVIQKNTKTTSSLSAGLTNKLKSIFIYSNIIDASQVFSTYESSSSNLYTFSSLLATLSIDTTQPLNGNFTEYNLNAMKLPCKNYTGQEIKFVVESGGDKNDYEIYLTLEAQ